MPVEARVISLPCSVLLRTQATMPAAAGTEPFLCASRCRERGLTHTIERRPLRPRRGPDRLEPALSLRTAVRSAQRRNGGFPRARLRAGLEPFDGRGPPIRGSGRRAPAAVSRACRTDRAVEGRLGADAARRDTRYRR